MIYESAVRENLKDIYNVVQNTIKTIYPKYYPADVVNFFCEHHGEKSILRDIENGYVGVLKVDGKIVATGSFVGNHITRVYVLPEYQKRGYGTFIISNIEDQIADEYDKVYLDASLPAAALYEKMGFAVVKHEKYPVENETVLVYEIMEKKLCKVPADINYDERKAAAKIISENEEVRERTIHSIPETAYEYKRATADDIEELVRTRITVLRAANMLADEVDMSEVEMQSYEYYRHALKNDAHIAYLVYDKGKFIGAGGVSFYQVMPTYHNPSGKKAYIMNMYTAPEYRRRGIACRTLDLLVEAARERGILQIALEATDMGRPLYEKYGFVKMEDELNYDMF